MVCVEIWLVTEHREHQLINMYNHKLRESEPPLAFLDQIILLHSEITPVKFWQSENCYWHLALIIKGQHITNI